MIDLDLRVDLVRFSTDRIDQLKRDTALDPMLNRLKEIIIEGWPATNRLTILLESERSTIHRQRSHPERETTRDTTQKKTRNHKTTPHRSHGTGEDEVASA